MLSSIQKYTENIHFAGLLYILKHSPIYTIYIYNRGAGVKKCGRPQARGATADPRPGGHTTASVPDNTTRRLSHWGGGWRNTLKITHSLHSAVLCGYSCTDNPQCLVQHYSLFLSSITVETVYRARNVIAYRFCSSRSNRGLPMAEISGV